MKHEMTTDPDILRAARHMIARHDIYAVYYAAMRAEDLRRSHAPRAAELWDRIALAILALNATRRGAAVPSADDTPRRQARG